MSTKRNKLGRVWRKFLRWCRLGKSKSKDREMVQRQLIEETPWAEARMITPSTNARPGRMDFEHQTHRDAPTSPLVIPELSHLTTQGSTQRSRLSIRHAHEVETEQWARRAPTSLLNDDMMFGERTISGSTQNSFDLDDSDDDLPVARYVPRSHKLIMTRSRNHLQIVPKSSPMSPLNGCDTAPLNQRRRTPAPFHIEAMAGVRSSIASFADLSSLRQSPPSYQAVQQEDGMESYDVPRSDFY